MILWLASTDTGIGRGRPAKASACLSDNHSADRHSWGRILGAAVALTLLLSGSVQAQGPRMRSVNPALGGGESDRSTSIQMRPAYMWAFNEIWFRDGDNALIRPSKKEVTLNSPALAIEVERSLMSDLSLRVQGFVNLPTDSRTDFLFDRPDQQRQTSLAWDTRSRFITGDLSMIYSLGPDDSPLRAGFVAGYRYHDFAYDSTRSQFPSGIFEDRMQVHVPYTGVYYEDKGFMGSNLRLDLVWSPLTLATLQSERTMLGTWMRIDGHAITGLWFDSYFAWSVSAGRGFSLGLFGRYNFIELSGGATIKNGDFSTRFSMDSRHHVILTGLSLAYAF